MRLGHHYISYDGDCLCAWVLRDKRCTRLDSAGVEMTDLDLRQMACLAQHKRHLNLRTTREKGCQWCGGPWKDDDTHGIKCFGETVMLYETTSRKWFWISKEQGLDDNAGQDYPEERLHEFIIMEAP